MSEEGPPFPPRFQVLLSITSSGHQGEEKPTISEAYFSAGPVSDCQQSLENISRMEEQNTNLPQLLSNSLPETPPQVIDFKNGEEDQINLSPKCCDISERMTEKEGPDPNLAFSDDIQLHDSPSFSKDSGSSQPLLWPEISVHQQKQEKNEDQETLVPNFQTFAALNGVIEQAHQKIDQSLSILQASNLEHQNEIAPQRIQELCTQIQILQSQICKTQNILSQNTSFFDFQNYTFSKKKEQNSFGEVNEIRHDNLEKKDSVAEEPMDIQVRFAGEPMDIEIIVDPQQQLAGQQNLIDDRKTADSVHQTGFINQQNNRSIENFNENEISSNQISAHQNNSAAEETVHTFFTNDNESLLRQGSLPQMHVHYSISQNQAGTKNRANQASLNENNQNSEVNIVLMQEVQKHSGNKQFHPVSSSSIYPNSFIPEFEYQDFERRSLSIHAHQSAANSISENQSCPQPEYNLHEVVQPYYQMIDVIKRELAESVPNKIEEQTNIEVPHQYEMVPPINLIKSELFTENNAESQINNQQNVVSQGEDSHMRQIVIEFFDGRPKIVSDKINSQLDEQNNFISLIKINQTSIDDSKPAQLNLFAEEPAPIQSIHQNLDNINSKSSQFTFQNKNLFNSNDSKQKVSAILEEAEEMPMSDYIDITETFDQNQPAVIEQEKDNEDLPVTIAIETKENLEHRIEQIDLEQLDNSMKTNIEINSELNVSIVESLQESKKEEKQNPSEIQPSQEIPVIQSITHQLNQPTVLQNLQNQSTLQNQLQPRNFDIKIKAGQDYQISVKANLQEYIQNSINIPHQIIGFNFYQSSFTNGLRQDSPSFPHQTAIRQQANSSNNTETQTQGIQRNKIIETAIQTQLSEQFLNYDIKIEEIWQLAKHYFECKSESQEINKKFVNAISQFINISYFPRPKNQIGNKLYKDGIFIVALIKLVTQFDETPFHASYLFKNIIQSESIEFNRYIFNDQAAKVVKQYQIYTKESAEREKNSQINSEDFMQKQNQLIKKKVSNININRYVYSYYHEEPSQKNLLQRKAISKQFSLNQIYSNQNSQIHEQKKVEQTGIKKSEQKQISKQLNLQKKDKKNENAEIAQTSNAVLTSQDRNKKEFLPSNSRVQELSKDRSEKLNPLQEKYFQLKYGLKEYNILKKEPTLDQSLDSFNQVKSNNKPKSRQKKSKNAHSDDQQSSLEPELIHEDQKKKRVSFTSIPELQQSKKDKTKKPRKQNKTKSKPKHEESDDEAQFVKLRSSKRKQ